MIRNIFCDSNEDVWIGTFSGLNKFNDKTGDFRVFKQNYNTDKSISANRINTIYELNGCLWIGTEGGGLNQVFLDSQEFISYNKQTKFPSDNIHGITSDQHDNLWISTNTNLIKFNTHTKEYMTYDQSDGLENKDYIDSSVGWQELEFYPNVVCKDINNTLFFGGILGLTFFHPDSLPQNKYKPLIYVNQFLVNSKDYNFNKKVVLNPKQNHIELSILSLNYIQPEKNKYAFFLENYDSVWQNTGNYNRIEYSNLPHGHYKLHYMGSNNDGVWSKETNPIIINVSPFYYQTKWFYFSILLFILFLIFLGFSLI